MTTPKPQAGRGPAIAQMIKRAATVLSDLRDPAHRRRTVQVLLTRLTLRQVDGTLTTGLLHEEALCKVWDGQVRFDEVLNHACDLRLLRITTRRLDEVTDDRLVSLGHDALAKVAQPWKDELEKRADAESGGFGVQWPPRPWFYSRRFRWRR